MKKQMKNATNGVPRLFYSFIYVSYSKSRYMPYQVRNMTKYKYIVCSRTYDMSDSSGDISVMKCIWYTY